MSTKPAFRNRFVLIGDISLIILVVLASFALRLELGPIFQFYLRSANVMILVALAIKPITYYFFGLYRRLWIYASTQELKLIASAVTVASVLVSAIMLSFFNLGILRGLPRSVLIIDYFLSLLAVGGLRLMLRILAESRAHSDRSSRGKVRNVLIVGAGDAGAMVVRELQRNPQLNIKPIGFLDDNPEKQKQHIYDVRVIGTIQQLAKVLDSHHVDEVIIAIPSAPGKVVRIVADICRFKGINFRTMPGIYELLGGQVSISRLREVDIADLLRREPTRIQDELVGLTLGKKRVLITGAGGSIGRELCRQVARWEPEELLLLGHGENSIFETVLEMKESFPALKCRPIIADIRDRERIKQVFESYHPEVVFHAAAHKHVPLMQINIPEAVSNNVLGTQCIVDACVEHDVERLVMISSDKAILPVNVMGATKRIAEMLVLEGARITGKPYSVVRFGNVLGSRGSVVPLFKRQIALGGPITVTHPDMKRYFMTIPEAVNLVLQAAGIGQGGEAFVLNMGEQVRILDLAEDLIRLTGLEPGKDIEIVFTGIRPGEKLSEDLWEGGHQFKPTEHPDIFRLDGQNELEGKSLRDAVLLLTRLVDEGDGSAIIATLDELIPGANVLSAPDTDITSIT